MEMLPGAVQVLIAWFEMIIGTILTFLRKRDEGDE